VGMLMLRISLEGYVHSSLNYNRGDVAFGVERAYLIHLEAAPRCV
jgi:hypothetical protein